LVVLKIFARVGKEKVKRAKAAFALNILIGVFCIFVSMYNSHYWSLQLNSHRLKDWKKIRKLLSQNLAKFFSILNQIYLWTI